MEAKVSIIIPFYNCSYVDQAISSALNQDYKNLEIIVIDDGSTTNTEKIEPFKKKIRYLKKDNGGTATALNYGIRVATGEYIAWLSSDDYFLPQKISKQISFMLNRSTEVSFTNFDIIDKNNQVIRPRACPSFKNINEVYKSFLVCNTINGCTVMIKKEVLNKIGLFIPTFRYTQDYEMWFRLLVNGYKIEYLDEVLTKFRQHEEAGTSKHHPEMLKEMASIEKKYRPILKEYLKKL